MDGLSVLYQSTHSAPLYNIGNAYGWLAKSSKTASAEYHLSGRLYLAKSGWLLLSVPNALVRGVFDAMSHAGAELPLAGTMNVPNVDKELLNAHISVMTAADVEAIGANKINERGHSFKYSLGPVKELTPNSVDGVSKLWAIQISSPELSALRKSYGLSALPKDEPFHITVAVRRKNVLRENDVSKFDTASGRGELKAAADLLPGGAADNMPDSDFPKKEIVLGVADEREHTNNDQIAKEIAKDHLQEDPAYYEKEKLNSVRKTPQIILQLRAAKDHSDNKRYDQKNHILRQLITAAPQDWVVDDPKPYHMGITHAPTKFRFHADPKIIPPVVTVSKAASQNPYIAQLFATAPSAIPGNTTWQNVVQHLRNVKTRGDRQAFAEQNTQGLLAELDPEHKKKLHAQIASKNYPRPDFLTRMIQQHGDSALNAVS
jgi:hypothetical protein